MCAQYVLNTVPYSTFSLVLNVSIGGSSVSDPNPDPYLLDPDSIRSVDPDPYSKSGSRRTKMTHKRRKKIRNLMF
jgi:hypothetical protein